MNKWDNRFFELAKHVSEWSKDTSTKTGAVIVKDRQILSIGYNGFPRGVDDENKPDRYTRPIKYVFTEHAERNAIFNAISNGTLIKDSVIYTTFFPCPDCCRAIIQTGIKEVISPKFDNATEEWKKEFAYSLVMFEEAGIIIKYI